MEFQSIIDFVWSGLATIGSLFLLLDVSLTRNRKVGVWIIFAGFVSQALYASYNMSKLPGAIGVLVIVIVGILLVLWKRKSQKDNSKSPSNCAPEADGII